MILKAKKRERIPPYEDQAALNWLRYCEGVIPVSALKARLKEVTFPKPQNSLHYAEAADNKYKVKKPFEGSEPSKGSSKGAAC